MTRPPGLAPDLAAAHDRFGNLEIGRAIASGQGPACEATRAPIGNAETARAQASAEPAPPAVSGATEDEAPGEGLFASIVRRAVPLLGEVLDKGVVGVVGPEVGSAVSDFVDAQLAAVTLDPVAEAVLSEVGEVVATLAGVVVADPSCCQALEAWLSGLAGLGPDWMRTPAGTPLLEAVTEESPAFAALGRVLAGDLEDVIAHVAPSVASYVAEIESGIAYVVSLDAEAGQWLADRLGLDDKDGVIGALRQLWDQLVAVFDRILAFYFAIPGPRLGYAIFDAGHDLFEAAQWIAANWGDPMAIARAPEALADNIYRGFVVNGLALARDVEQLVPAFVNGVRDFADALDAFTGLSMFGAPLDVVVGLRDFAVRVSESPLWGEVTDIVGALASFALGTLSAVAQLLFAILRLEGPMDLLELLASDVFAAVPDCYKAVIVDVLVAFVTKWFVTLGYAAMQAMVGDEPALAEALYTSAVAFLDRVWAVPADQKAALLESSLAFLFGLDPFAFALGIASGLAVGTVESLLSMAGETVALGFEALKATAIGLEVGGGLLDALGDRVFDRAPADSDEGDGAPGVAAVATLTIEALDLFAAMFTDPASPLRDPEVLAVFLGEAVEGLFAGVGAVGGELAAAAIAALAQGKAADFNGGYWLGEAAGGVLAATAAKRLALVKDANLLVRGLAMLLAGGQAEEAMVEALADRVVAAVFAFGRQLASVPGMRALAAKLVALAEAVLGWVQLRTSDTVHKLAEFVIEALGFGEDEIRALIGRVLGKRAADDDAFVEKVVEIVDGWRGAARLPDGFDPRKSARENLLDLLRARIGDLVGGGEDEDEDEDEDDGGGGPDDAGAGEPTRRRDRDGDIVEVDVPVPQRTVDQALREASPEVRAAIAIAVRLGAGDFTSVGEQAGAQIQREIDVDWVDVVARGAEVAAEQRDLLVWDLAELRTMPADGAGPTSYAGVMASLVHRTVPELQRAFPAPEVGQDGSP